LAVPSGRDIAPTINRLLSLPYALKIATKDFHPNNHVSFDTAHPSVEIRAFESFVTLTNPLNNADSRKIPIWPKHCVQGTKGAEIIPEIDGAKLDVVLEKGRDENVEMFSAFADVFGNKSDAASLDLAALLRTSNISRVDIVGLAGDYCVACTALDAQKEGFEVFIIEEGVKSIDPGPEGWGKSKEALQTAGVRIVSVDDPDIAFLGPAISED
jgi:nicotinamidase-related amidase